MRGTTTYSADRTTFYGNFHLLARKRCPYAFHSVNPHLLSATVAITQKSKKWSQALTHTQGSLRPLNATASWGLGFPGAAGKGTRIPQTGNACTMPKCRHAHRIWLSVRRGLSCIYISNHPWVGEILSHPPPESHCIIINVSCNEADGAEV